MLAAVMKMMTVVHCATYDSDSLCSSGKQSELDIRNSVEDGITHLLGVDRNNLKLAFDGLSRTTALRSKCEGKQKNAAQTDICAGNSSRDAQPIGSMLVLPLYAQLRVFEDIKEGEWLVVVATNVAESLRHLWQSQG